MTGGLAEQFPGTAADTARGELAPPIVAPGHVASAKRGPRPLLVNAAFAAKVISIGIFAGAVLTYCLSLLDACIRAIH